MPAPATRRPNWRQRAQRGGEIGEHAGARLVADRIPLPALQHRAGPGQLEGGHGEGVVAQVGREHDRAFGVRRRHPGRPPAAVVDGAQQPRQVVGAQLGAGGRRAVPAPHVYDRATPRGGGLAAAGGRG
jgi:hypothetical protein